MENLWTLVEEDNHMFSCSRSNSMYMFYISVMHIHWFTLRILSMAFISSGSTYCSVEKIRKISQFIVTTDCSLWRDQFTFVFSLHPQPCLMDQRGVLIQKKYIYSQNMNDINITAVVFLPAQEKTRTLTPVPQKYPHRASWWSLLSASWCFGCNQVLHVN